MLFSFVLTGQTEDEQVSHGAEMLQPEVADLGAPAQGQRRQ